MDNVEEIKKRIDIVEFIGTYLQLKKAGINFSALCPFHSEKTPSFMISPIRQSFKCFGCNEGGDVITFFMKMEGFSFPEALKVLGERVGVQVSLKPKEQVDREKTKRDRLLKINLLAAKYFKMVLWSGEGKPALDYLLKRGLTKETIEKFKLGFAPANSRLGHFFSKYKFSSDEIALAGHPERFRYRIMFPIFNPLSQIIGFSGRILEEVLPSGVSPHPKYLNTPETPVFYKSRALYGINLAKDAIRQKKRAVVVEGQMDVISSSQAGIEEVVACSGTALTSEHLKLLGRFSQNIIFAFDEDEAGQKAALSAVEMALSAALEVKLTTILGYKDVGELTEKNPSEWAKIVDSALPPVEWLVAKAQKTKKATDLSAQEKKDLVRKSVAFIARMQDEIERAHYIGYLAKIVAVPRDSVEKVLARQKVKVENPSAGTDEPKRNLEIEIIAFLLNFSKIAGKISLPKTLDFEDENLAQVYKRSVKCYKEAGEVEKNLAKIKDDLSSELKEVLAVASLEWDVKAGEDSDKAIVEFNDIVRNLQSKKNEQLKSDFAKKIAQADSRGDVEEVKRLMTELQKSL